MKYSIFIPVRKGSERVLKKNTRDFAGIKGGLLNLKLRQLESIKENYEIVVSTDDEDSLKIASSFKDKIKNLKVIERPGELGKSTTPLRELIEHAGMVCSGDSVLWTHVTSPFCDALEYIKAIEFYDTGLKKNYDSLISGRDYKEFLLDKKSGKFVNNNTELSWPRTQDLSDCFEINNAIFLTARENYKMGNRTGTKPILHTQNKIVSLDIDYEEDFKIAEAVYDRFYR
ncbi:N-acylneuraminate cytidylyltransferase [Salegentibacter sp. 24]|uniref:cytidylyltransferase domain-containing protein n=1 Tax=Salegentibacter sp. 24 TaxID=2183986 RepID=UPI00105B5708|nr:acylneuraminate cytidylyltransferase family protein [Salegentibacter sp. 24]TDN82169.1 N-acylneuraminate cytidylyltransferase [Salegentibacter sp. 24]